MFIKLMDQELLTLPQHLRSSPVFSGVRVTRSLVLYVCFVDRCLSFCTFLLAIVLSVLLRYTHSGCPFDIFKLFFFVGNSERTSYIGTWNNRICLPYSLRSMFVLPFILSLFLLLAVSKLRNEIFLYYFLTNWFI